MLEAGMDRKAIALRLRISVATVVRHIKDIRSRCGQNE